MGGSWVIASGLHSRCNDSLWLLRMVWILHLVVEATAMPLVSWSCLASWSEYSLPLLADNELGVLLQLLELRDAPSQTLPV